MSHFHSIPRCITVSAVHTPVCARLCSSVMTAALRVLVMLVSLLQSTPRVLTRLSQVHFIDSNVVCADERLTPSSSSSSAAAAATALTPTDVICTTTKANSAFHPSGVGK